MTSDEPHLLRRLLGEVVRIEDLGAAELRGERELAGVDVDACADNMLVLNLLILFKY